MSLEIMINFFKIGMELLLAHTADDTAPSAVAAISSAPIRHQKQDTIRVSMHKPWNRHVRVFPARVAHLDRRTDGFFDSRNYLAPDWAIRIKGIDEVKKVRCDAKSELITRKQYTGPFFSGQRDLIFELFESSDPIFELPLPIVPRVRWNIGPKALAKRNKPLISGFG